MPQSLPKISIVTPVYNGGSTLRETIQSIIEQEYPNLQYIVVDGGSTDDSLQIVHEYSPHVSQLIQGKDRTLYDAVAKGFDVATGEVLAWLNSDDLYVPGILHRIGRLFAENPGWQVIFGDDAVWKQNWLVANRPQRPVGMPELLAGKVIPQASTFFRNEAYKAVGGLERQALKLAGDYQLWLRFAARYELHFIPEQVSVFRIRPRQLSGDWNAYAAEMQAVARGAHAHMPPMFSARTAPARFRRSLQARRQHRAFFYPLENETLNWPYVEPPPRQPLGECRCLICDAPPQRLLFSTPDARFGDRRIWSIYFCEWCQLAFRFPHAPHAMQAEIRNAAANSDFASLPAVPPGVYSPFKTKRRLPDHLHYRLLGALAGKRGGGDVPAEEYITPAEPRSLRTIAIDAWGDKTARHLRQQGFTNVEAENLHCQAPGKTLGEMAVLGQSFQHCQRPVEFLTGLRHRLSGKARVYLSLPNLDSVFLQRFGPCWSQWHAPFHSFTTGRLGLKKLAEKAGFCVRWMRSTSPPNWLYLSDQIAARGLFTHVLDDCQHNDFRAWQSAAGASWVAHLLHDWRGRGDCLHACFEAEELD